MDEASVVRIGGIGKLPYRIGRDSRSNRRLPMNKYAKRVALFISIILACLAVLEVAMIILEPWMFKGFYQYDRDLGFRVRPYANGTNRFGFNDADYPLQKSPNTTRILVLGDSFNWAGGREKNYTAVLRRKFQDHRAPRVEIINAGYPMTHTGEQLALLKTFGLQYNPDFVLLGFFAGNDFLDADPNRKRVVVNDLYLDIDRRRELIILGYPIIPTSRLVTFIRQKYRVFKEFVTPQANATDNDKGPGTFPEGTFLEIERARLEFCNLDSHRVGAFDRHMRYVFDSVTEMQVLLSRQNIDLVVAIFPDEFQVNEKLLEALIGKYRLRREAYDIELAQKLLTRFLELRGIPYKDLLNEFRAEGRNGQFYLLRDTHWNDKGNEFAASRIFPHLLKMVEAVN